MMVQMGRTPRSAAIGVLYGLLTFDTAALFVATVVHAIGVRVALGGATFDERRLIPAAVVEGMACALFVAADYAIFTGAARAWRWVVAAHVFAIAGFLLGIWATSQQGGANSQFNYVYHRVMLAIFVLGLALLLLRTVRASFERGGR